MKNTAPQTSKAAIQSSIEKQSYRGIQFSGVLFVILMAGMLIANIMVSDSLKDDSSGINLAGRQRMLSQRMTKSMATLLTSISNSDMAAAAKAQKELKLSSGLFQDTLHAFRDGGVTTGATGDQVTLIQVVDPTLADHVAVADGIWQQLASGIEYLAHQDVASIDTNKADTIMAALSANNLELLKLMNLLTVGLEKNAESKSSTLQLVLAGALALVVANFAYVILYSVGLLKKRDGKLEEFSTNLIDKNSQLSDTNLALESAQTKISETNNSLESALGSLKVSNQEAQKRAGELEKLTVDLNRLKEESDTIFNSVDHGLCLIDKNFKIGRRVSLATYEIFETKHLTNLSFLDLMRPLITEKDLKTLQSFLKLQFQTKTLSSQLEKYNPLKKIEITLNWDGARFVNKHLGFAFERIMEGDEIAAVLITITDVTETLALENELKRASEDQARKTDILLEVIQSDASELGGFLARTEATLDSINELLRDQGVSSEADLSERVEKLVESVFQKVHTIKGNSSMLGLKSITEITHTVEDKLAALRNRNDVKGDEFLSSLVQLATLRERLSDYQEITDTILKDFATGKPRVPSAAPLSDSQHFAQELSQFAGKVANDLSKEVFLKSQLEIDNMHADGQQAIKDICIQLTRNSIVHGIEAPQVRKAQGKLSEGLIRVHCVKSNAENKLGVPCYELTFRDDGAGLDLPAIKQRAVNLGLIDAEKATTLSNNEAVSLIFEPKFSTQVTANEHAGRGTGMSIIKDIINSQLSGKLSLSYAVGQYAQLSFLIPVESVELTTSNTVEI